MEAGWAETRANLTLGHDADAAVVAQQVMQGVFMMKCSGMKVVAAGTGRPS
jgi:hypothetical protein